VALYRYIVPASNCRVRDVSMWTAIPAIVVCRRGARLRDAVRLRAARARARARARTADRGTAGTCTADSSTDCSAILAIALVWRHRGKHATTRPHFDVRQ